MKDIKEIFARNLADLRQEAGLTQAELGHKLNYSDKTVSKWERGESMPDAGVLKDIAEEFDVTVDYLLEKDHDKPKPKVDDPEDAEAADQTHWNIRFIVQAGVWLFACVLVVLCWIITRSVIWRIFVWFLPVSFLLSIIFTGIWSRHKSRDLFIFISLFILSILTAIYLSALKYNLWMLFLIMIPVEILLLFIFKLVFDIKKRKKQRDESEVEPEPVDREA